MYFLSLFKSNFKLIILSLLLCLPLDDLLALQAVSILMQHILYQCFKSFTAALNTPCFSAPAESTSESSPVKI